MPVGVYAGAGINAYLLNNLTPSQNMWESMNDLQWIVGNGVDYMTTMVGHKLNLRGPCAAVQTACFTSLVVINLVCQSLLVVQCDMDLADGISIRVPHHAGYIYKEGGILSSEDHCRTFDHKAMGRLSETGQALLY